MRCRRLQVDDAVSGMGMQPEEASARIVDADTGWNGERLSLDVDRQVLVNMRHGALARVALDAVDGGRGIGTAGKDDRHNESKHDNASSPPPHPAVSLLAALCGLLTLPARLPLRKALLLRRFSIRSHFYPLSSITRLTVRHRSDSC